MIREARRIFSLRLWKTTRRPLFIDHDDDDADDDDGDGGYINRDNRRFSAGLIERTPTSEKPRESVIC